MDTWLYTMQHLTVDVSMYIKSMEVHMSHMTTDREYGLEE